MCLVLFVALLARGACYECIAGSGEETEKTRTGRTWVSLDCGERTITKVKGYPRLPSRRRGSEIEETNNHFTLAIKPYIYVQYECTNMKRGVTREKEAWTLDDRGELLNSISASCPSNQKISVNVIGKTHEKDDLEECVGEKSCVVSVKMSYKVEYGCRARKNSQNCCDSESSQGSQNYVDNVGKACGITLTCECCDREDDEFINIKACAEGSARTIGISFDGEAYGDSDDDATDDQPDKDEEGCHVRRATMLDSDNNEQSICIPGNMAKILRVLDKFVTTAISSDSMCRVRRTDSGCEEELSGGVAYRFGVTVRTPGKTKSENWIRRHLEDVFEEQDLSTSFLISVDTNLQNDEGFAIWFPL